MYIFSEPVSVHIFKCIFQCMCVFRFWADLENSQASNLLLLKGRKNRTNCKGKIECVISQNVYIFVLDTMLITFSSCSNKSISFVNGKHNWNCHSLCFLKISSLLCEDICLPFIADVRLFLSSFIIVFFLVIGNCQCLSCFMFCFILHAALMRKNLEIL